MAKKRTYRGTDYRAPVFVFGDQFGWKLLTLEADCDDALSEFDERHGTRVEPSDVDLQDYDGATLADKYESAMNAGDIRVNSGGTTVWVDHYEWMREFPTVSEARAFLRGGRL